jgi:hypothetical protein
MTNSVVSRLGQINKAGDTSALFLKLVGGEVMVAFDRACVFKDYSFTRQINGGKSATFPFIGGATAAYHTPGNFIDGQTIAHNEKVITVDDLLQSAIFVANIDEAMNYYDVRQPYSEELGRTLAHAYDINVARMFVKAARSAHPITAMAGGSVIDHVNMATDGAILEAALFKAAQVMDEKDLSSEGRNGFFRPLQFYALAQRDKLLNKDIGGSGAIKDGTLETVAGIKLVKSNHVPSTNVTTGPAKYQGDFSKTVGIVSMKEAVGTVKLLDLSMESEYEIRRQGTFMVAKYAVGHDTLRVDTAIELATAAPGDTDLTPTTN